MDVLAPTTHKIQRLYNSQFGELRVSLLNQNIYFVVDDILRIYPNLNVFENTEFKHRKYLYCTECNSNAVYLSLSLHGLISIMHLVTEDSSAQAGFKTWLYKSGTVTRLLTILTNTGFID